MVFIYSGTLLVTLEGLRLFGWIGPGEPTALPAYFRWGMPGVLVAAAFLQFPLERVQWALFAGALVLGLNRQDMPVPGLTTAAQILIGLYLTWYGWRTRRVDRRERKAALLFLGWLALAGLLGLLLAQGSR